MVQLQEDLDDNIKKQNAIQKKSTLKMINFLDSINKPHILTEIGKERLRRASKDYKAGLADIGFRVLKLDSSCMKDVYYLPNKMTQASISDYVDNIKKDRTGEDLLFQVMLQFGIMPSSKIQTLSVQGKNVFNVEEGKLVCCFDENLSEKVVEEIAKLQPVYAVFRDSSMASDSVNVNFDQIFERYSRTTVRKVL